MTLEIGQIGVINFEVIQTIGRDLDVDIHTDETIMQISNTTAFQLDVQLQGTQGPPGPPAAVSALPGNLITQEADGLYACFDWNRKDW